MAAERTRASRSTGRRRTSSTPQLDAWDKVIDRAGSRPLLRSDRLAAARLGERVCYYDLFNSPDYKLAYDHYFPGEVKLLSVARAHCGPLAGRFSGAARLLFDAATIQSSGTYGPWSAFICSSTASAWVGKAFAWFILDHDLRHRLRGLRALRAERSHRLGLDVRFIMYGALFMMAGPIPCPAAATCAATSSTGCWPPRVQATIDLVLYFALLLPRRDRPDLRRLHLRRAESWATARSASTARRACRSPSSRPSSCGRRAAVRCRGSRS